MTTPGIINGRALPGEASGECGHVEFRSKPIQEKNVSALRAQEECQKNSIWQQRIRIKWKKKKKDWRSGKAWMSGEDQCRTWGQFPRVLCRYKQKEFKRTLRHAKPGTWPWHSISYLIKNANKKEVWAKMSGKYGLIYWPRMGAINHELIKRSQRREDKLTGHPEPYDPVSHRYIKTWPRTLPFSSIFFPAQFKESDEKRTSQFPGDEQNPKILTVTGPWKRIKSCPFFESNQSCTFFEKSS